MTDPSRMRISDTDRNDVIDRLQQATVEGRLDLDELDERIAGALAARTWSDVDPLLDDLPDVEEPSPGDDADESPRYAVDTARLGSMITLGAGAMSIAASLWSPWGALLGIISAVLGAILLLGPGELSRGSRFAVLTGLVLGLMPATFYVMLLLVLVGE